MKHDCKFAAFILTHKRPHKVITYDTLKRCGYTGKVFIVIDNTDPTHEEYLKKFGDQVLVFNKQEMASQTDQGDNFNDLRTTTHARNAISQFAKDMGFCHFIALDDDYKTFDFRFNDGFNYYPPTKRIKNLDKIFKIMSDFQHRTKCLSVAMAQGGDFIGGKHSKSAQRITLTRKCMNTFVCGTDTPFKFFSRLNEDVNTYISLGMKGGLFFTANQISIVQATTQKTAGGMTETYKDNGTYVKSFFSVMYHPSGVKVAFLNTENKRLHHLISWKNTAPKILREDQKKGKKNGTA
jgi:hypothetical protein